MEIAKNTTNLTKKMLTAFQNREIFKKSWVVAICAIALIIVSFRIVDGKVVLNSIPFLVIGCTCYPAYVGTLELLFVKQNKTFIPVIIEYTFTENSIKMEGDSSLGKESSEMYYDKLEKIVFTKKYIYLYINKVSALVVDINKFTIGDAEKVKSLIKLKFPHLISKIDF